MEHVLHNYDINKRHNSAFLSKDDNVHEEIRPTIPVYGLPGPVFDLVHITALVSLTISILCSAGVIVYFLKGEASFSRRNIGERLVLYLAVCDMGFSVSHTMDHAYMLAVRNHPPDVPCIIFAFCVAEFIFAQALVIGFTAISVVLLVVREVRLSLGRYDWRLLLISFGLPAASLVLVNLCLSFLCVSLLGYLLTK